MLVATWLPQLSHWKVWSGRVAMDRPLSPGTEMGASRVSRGAPQDTQNRDVPSRRTASLTWRTDLFGTGLADQCGIDDRLGWIRYWLGVRSNHDGLGANRMVGSVADFATADLGHWQPVIPVNVW